METASGRRDGKQRQANIKREDEIVVSLSPGVASLLAIRVLVLPLGRGICEQEIRVSFLSNSFQLSPSQPSAPSTPCNRCE